LPLSFEGIGVTCAAGPPGEPNPPTGSQQESPVRAKHSSVDASGLRIDGIYAGHYREKIALRFRQAPHFNEAYAHILADRQFPLFSSSSVASTLRMRMCRTGS
jgi:hypothetical protein